MDYIATVSGEDHEFTIDYKMGWVDNLRDGLEWSVWDWTVTHVDGWNLDKATQSIWASKLDEERVCNEIMLMEEDA